MQKKRWRDRKRKAIELFGGKCQSCGYQKNIAALQFHHFNKKTKEFSWNELKSRSWASIIEELKKCILLCANCHAELHSSDENLEFSSGNQDNKFLNKIIVPTGLCPTCQAEVFGTKYCSVKCVKFASRKVVRPSKKELMKKIRDMSMVAIGNAYRVSDNTIRKWAKSYDIPI
jgi:hypothetical protein